MAMCTLVQMPMVVRGSPFWIVIKNLMILRRREIFFSGDLKTNDLTEEVSSIDVLYPTNALDHNFSTLSPVPVIAHVNYSGSVLAVE